MLRVSQIKIDCLLSQEGNIERALIRKLHIKREELIKYHIVKRSIDARDKNRIFYVYEIDVNIKNENVFLKHNEDKNIGISNSVEYNP
ncbi:MAG: hypothetical protein K2I70_04235, partial [Bacilli bacterium]|nr:hypothetical protein [Bacilli bacterium]